MNICQDIQHGRRSFFIHAGGSSGVFMSGLVSVPKKDAGGRIHHISRYNFNNDVLPIGVSYWVKLVEKELPI